VGEWGWCIRGHPIGCPLLMPHHHASQSPLDIAPDFTDKDGNEVNGEMKMLNDGQSNERQDVTGQRISLILAILLCSLIVGILAYGSGRQNEARSRVPASYSQSAKIDAAKVCTARNGNVDFDCVYDQVEASQEQARGELDLTAQQGAAYGAMSGAAVSLLALIVSVVGVWLVKRTLDATLVAVKDTSAATEAMQMANRIAQSAADTSAIATSFERNIKERESMPYVLVAKVTCQKEDDRTYNFVIDVENVGKTPAIDVFVIAVIGYFIPEGQYYEEAHTIAAKIEYWASVSKSCKHRIGAIGALPKQVFVKSFVGEGQKNCAIVKGVVIYSDFSGKNFVSQFFFSIGDHILSEVVQLPMTPGSLRMATFHPYEGPELRNRDGY
jgi:hypothetical protein